MIKATDLEFNKDYYFVLDLGNGSFVLTRGSLHEINTIRNSYEENKFYIKARIMDECRDVFEDDIFNNIDDAIAAFKKLVREK
jgi:hypothetical protein